MTRHNLENKQELPKSNNILGKRQFNQTEFKQQIDKIDVNQIE